MFCVCCLFNFYFSVKSSHFSMMDAVFLSVFFAFVVILEGIPLCELLARGLKSIKEKRTVCVWGGGAGEGNMAFSTFFFLSFLF